MLTVGSRLTDFATASQSLFSNPDVRFASINVDVHDAGRLGSDRNRCRRQAGVGCADPGRRGFRHQEPGTNGSARSAPAMISGWQSGQLRWIPTQRSTSRLSRPTRTW